MDESIKCFIVLTNTAREAIKQHFQDEHAFFKLQNTFDVYLEKQAIEQTSIALTIFFDNKQNKKLATKFDERVVIMDCAFDLKNGLVAKSFRTKGKHTPIKTNRREKMRIHFVPSRINGHTYPEIFISTIAGLPVSQDRFDYVNKRISSWEGYLKVLNKNANIDDIDATFGSVKFNADYSVLTLRCSGIEDKQWKQLKGLSAYVKGYKREIGEVVKANSTSRFVDIELNPKITKLVRNNDFELTSEQITFSNASTKSQLHRLLKGFERLKEGLAANANLENILFEDQPIIAERKNNIQLEFHNPLNEYQRDAVIGAMSAEDLYVIQGPPGTGKTTVISEICYQNVKAGLKTLIASQSNLAVDNALGRLLSNKDIRILRYGRTESIEEEGKKYIEENVAEYWKRQTFEAITNEIMHHATKENELKEKISESNTQIEKLQEKEKSLQQEIIKKEEATSELTKVKDEISQLKKQLSPLKIEREKTAQAIEKLKKSEKEIKEKIQEIQLAVVELGSSETINIAIQKAEEQISKSKQLLEYTSLKEQLYQTENQLTDIQKQSKQLEINTENKNSVLNQIQSIKKIYEVEKFIETHQIKRGYVLNQLFLDLEKIHHRLLEFKPVKQISERLNKAIEYSQKTLGIHVSIPELSSTHHYSLQEINEFLTKLSRAFASKQINPDNGTRSIQGLHLRRLYLDELLLRYRSIIDESLFVFDKIKEEVTYQVMEQEGIDQSTAISLKEKENDLTRLVAQYQQQLQTLEETLEQTSIITSTSNLKLLIDTLNDEIKQLLENKTKLKETDILINKKQQELETVINELENGKKALQIVEEKLKTLNSTGLLLEKKAEQLEQITLQNPEIELEKTQELMVQTEKLIQQLNKKITMLPITQSLQLEWKSLLEQANEHDLDEIRKLYVKHANVIGTTCVASANKEFMDNYPNFDVVIIDEVSKATPPELLLPMLKGKKIILVGDHHQLPPLIGDDTLEETLETIIKESDTFEEKIELEKLLEESLFERLYKNLPNSNKKMLAIQYRMHQNIMETIAPFYKNGKESLKCGLVDSDSLRDHKMNGKFVKRDEHLLWVDIPNENGFFEERMKEGSSLFNESELKTIRKMLIDLNASTENAKNEGLLPHDECKSVGVISFYAEQVKRINRLIDQELNLPHLHIRTGSVDKFQGMEMDIILVSMVRNHHNKQGDIGFAKDYRRLNVALSRARELLILIGSTDMFTKRPKSEETRSMYSHLLEVVKKQSGYREYIEIQ